MSSKFLDQNDATVLVVVDDDTLYKEKTLVIDNGSDTNKMQRKRRVLTLKYPKRSCVINESYKLPCDLTEYLMKNPTRRGYSFINAAEHETMHDVKAKICYIALEDNTNDSTIDLNNVRQIILKYGTWTPPMARSALPTRSTVPIPP